MESKDTRSEAQKQLDEYRRTGKAHYDPKDDEIIEDSNQDQEPQTRSRAGNHARLSQPQFTSTD